MGTTLELADRTIRDDLRVYLQRLERSGEPEVRVVTRGTAVAVYGCTQSPQSLLDRMATVLVMRAFELSAAPNETIDTTVTARALLDRLARPESEGLQLPLPESTVATAWAGVLPPISGWEASGVFDAPSLASVAREGIERIAAALPESPGEAIVRSVRERVWGTDVAPGVPAAAAFAAETMGFLRDEQRVSVSHTRTWLRLTTRRGHILVRSPMG